LRDVAEENYEGPQGRRVLTEIPNEEGILAANAPWYLGKQALLC
jgi:hypothetical protein